MGYCCSGLLSSLPNLALGFCPPCLILQWAIVKWDDVQWAIVIVGYCPLCLIYRVRTDLEKSLNLTLVLENSWNLKIVPFVLELSGRLEVCKIALENVKSSFEIMK